MGEAVQHPLCGSVPHGLASSGVEWVGSVGVSDCILFGLEGKMGSFGIFVMGAPARGLCGPSLRSKGGVFIFFSASGCPRSSCVVEPVFELGAPRPASRANEGFFGFVYRVWFQDPHPQNLFPPTVFILKSPWRSTTKDRAFARAVIDWVRAFTPRNC